MPAGAIYVGRPTVFGNPFKTAEEFKRWLVGEMPFRHVAKKLELLRRLPELRGKDLACWCALEHFCHADVLLEFANLRCQACGAEFGPEALGSLKGLCRDCCAGLGGGEYSARIVIEQAKEMRRGRLL